MAKVNHDNVTRVVNAVDTKLTKLLRDMVDATTAHDTYEENRVYAHLSGILDDVRLVHKLVDAIPPAGS